MPAQFTSWVVSSQEKLGLIVKNNFQDKDHYQVVSKVADSPKINHKPSQILIQKAGVDQTKTSL